MKETQADSHLVEALRGGLDDGDLIGAAPVTSGAEMVALSRRFGVVPLVNPGSSVSDDDEVRLGAAVSYYRDLLGDTGRRRIRGLFIATDVEPSDLPPRAARLSITKHLASDGTWAKVLVPNALELSEAEFAVLRSLVFPAASVLSTRSFEDDHAIVNNRARINLDAQQIAIATTPTQRIVHITGGAGSGKTVVLIARAQWLAAEHPDWRILLLCYNEALRVSLAQQLAHVPTVEVTTFRAAARAVDITIKEFGSDAQATTEAAIQKALRLGLGAESVDAILIDEGQDFGRPWLKLLFSWIRPGRGGLTIATDPSQGLYQLAGNGAAAGIVKEESPEAASTIELPWSYRTTRQILEAAVLSSGAKHKGLDISMEGSRVQLIWAPSRAEQSECIAWEIRKLMGKGVVDRYSEIGILFTNRFVLDNNPFSNHLTAALETQNIPFIVRAQAGKLAPLGSNEVTITTVHSAKGKEFSAVFVIGTEALKTGDDPSASDERGAQPKREVVDSRAAYVAFTRARNILMLTYTKPNSVISRLHDLPFVDKLSWPVDYVDGRPS